MPKYYPSQADRYAPGTFVWEYDYGTEELVKLGSDVESLISSFERMKKRIQVWGDNILDNADSSEWWESTSRFGELLRTLELYGRNYDAYTMPLVLSINPIPEAGLAPTAVPTEYATRM